MAVATAAGAAILVGAAIAGVSALRGNGQDAAGEAGFISASQIAPSIAPPATPSEPSPSIRPTAPSSSPVPTATPHPSGAAPLKWAETAKLSGAVRDIAWIDGGWLAVGSSERRAAAWFSSDGIRWEPAPDIDPPPVNDPVGGWNVSEWGIHLVVEYAGSLIGLGAEHVGPADGSQIAIWTSTDGVTWTNIPTRGSSVDTYHWPVSAVIAPSGDLVLAAEAGLGSGTVFWVTSDGTAWTPHDLTGETSGDRVDEMAASSSTILAVGISARPAPEGGAGVWTSADGRTWTPHDAPPGCGAWLGGATYDAARGQFVVTGLREDGRAGVWLTADGTSWTTIALSDEAGRTAAVAARDSVIVVVGSVGPQMTPRAMTWSSHDGLTWQILPVGGTGIGVVEVGPGGSTVAAGTDLLDNGQYQTSLWRGTLVP